jgi:hypothetical protein
MEAASVVDKNGVAPQTQTQADFQLASAEETMKRKPSNKKKAVGLVLPNVRVAAAAAAADRPSPPISRRTSSPVIF